MSKPHVKSQILRLALVSIATTVAGVVIGLVLNYRTLKELRSPSVAHQPSIVIEEKEQEKIATYSGKIKPSIQPEIAAHYLEDAEGKIIVFLTSGKIESGFLEMLEGQMVEVVGTVKKTVEGDQAVMEVAEVRL